MTTELKALIERFDHLRDSGVCSPTTRGLLDDAQSLLSTLSTPPTDDVREAVMNALACHRRKVTVPAFNRPVCSCGWASTTVDYGSYAFDGHIADAVADEVRPRGTVTDADVEAGALAIEENDAAQPSGAFDIHEDNRGKARAVLEATRGGRS